jgi:hypothetical protein
MGQSLGSEPGYHGLATARAEAKAEADAEADAAHSRHVKIKLMWTRAG